MNLRRGVAILAATSALATASCEAKPHKPVLVTAEQQAQIDTNAKKAAHLALDASIKLSSPKNCQNTTNATSRDTCEPARVGSNGTLYESSSAAIYAAENDEDLDTIQLFVGAGPKSTQVLTVIVDQSQLKVDKKGKQLPNTYVTDSESSIIFTRAHVGSAAVASIADIEAIIDDPATHVEGIKNDLTGIAYGSDYQTNSIIKDSQINLYFADFNPTDKPKAAEQASYIAGHQVSTFVSDIPLS